MAKIKLSDNTIYEVKEGDKTHLDFVLAHAKKNKLSAINLETQEELIKLKEEKSEK